MNGVNLQKIAAGLTLATVIAVPAMLPASAQAVPQSHRQKNKNTWRNLGIAGAGAGVLGLATHNKTLAIGGLAGGAYSAYRYEQDRKGQSRAQANWRRHHYAHHTVHHSYTPHHYHHRK